MRLTSCCPRCHGDISLSDTREELGDVMCPHCKLIVLGDRLLAALGDGASRGEPIPAAGDPTDASGSSLAAETGHAAPPDFAGTEFAGCVLEEKLGHGATGVVYKGRHKALAIPVAVKILLEPAAEVSEQAKARFFQEARAAARLRHPNIVGVLNVGEERGRNFIVMQFVDGQTLERRVLNHGPLPVSDALRLAIQMCDALETLRQNGIVHRDIKPANTIVDDEGTARLADLGLAKDIMGESNLTSANVIMGTPHYVAPEQTLDARAADHRADLYSLGCTLYFALCGSTPYEAGSAFDVIHKHHTSIIPNARDHNLDVPASLAAILQRLMAKKPDQRYQTAAAVLEDLRKVDVGAPADSGPPDLRNVRALVVDDLKAIRLFFRTSLESAGAEVLEARNGVDALTALNSAAHDGQPVNLVMTDVRMPEMDGLELLRRIRQSPELRDVPVVVITMEEDQSVVLSFAKLGIASYIVKPPKARQVLDAAQQAVRFRNTRIAPESPRSGLSVAQVRELYRWFTDAVELARQKGTLRTESLFEEPLYVGFIELIQRTCPEALDE